MAILAAIGFLLGIAMLLAFRRLSRQDAIRRAKSRLQAHLYEMRLFTDEPALVWRAQCGLVAANVRYLGLMLLPAAAIAVPMLPLFSALECFYGHAPLAPGSATVVTVRMNTAGSPVPVLRAPAGIAVETPGVRVDGGREISWRIRALRPVRGALQFVFPDRTVTKSVTVARPAGPPGRVSERRVSSLAGMLVYPGESRLPAGRIDWIEVRYPEATLSALGLDFTWLVWLLAFSMLTALALKSRFRVSF